MKRRALEGPELDSRLFQKNLMEWYRAHARELPWRGTIDPYRIWLSETMLQQTRVAAVIEHYHEFLLRFPTLLALALAPEQDVLAAWSGLGYYRRARMLHKAAQFITAELGGVLPATSTELRTLPGIGEYTSAAIASIAFGESIAVVDGNVERVLLRLTGRPEDPTAAGRSFLRTTAQQLVPPSVSKKKSRKPQEPPVNPSLPTRNPPGDHNQAMMELGATICLPRAPLCLQCPVCALCQTKGEHSTTPRARLRSHEIAFLLSIRKRGVVTEVLLAQRSPEASLMAGMYELPPLPLDPASDEMAGREPLLRIRHAITNTNYYVRIYAPTNPADKALRRSVPVARDDLHWVAAAKLLQLPLTGLCRKVLQRLNVMAVRPLHGPQQEDRPTPAKQQPRRKLNQIVDKNEDHDSF